MNYRGQTVQNKKIFDTIVTFCAPEVSRQSPATTIRPELLVRLLSTREEVIHIWRKNQIRISLCRMSMQVPLRPHLHNRFSQLRTCSIKWFEIQSRNTIGASLGLVQESKPYRFYFDWPAIAQVKIPPSTASLISCNFKIDGITADQLPESDSVSEGQCEVWE